MPAGMAAAEGGSAGWNGSTTLGLSLDVALIALDTVLIVVTCLLFLH